MYIMYLFKCHKVLQSLQFNPRPTGGGGYFEPPLSFSCDIF